MEVGQFVCVEDGLGLGKISKIDGESVVVSYFDSPMCMVAHEAQCYINAVDKSSLLIETVVSYYEHESEKWLTGRIVGEAPPPSDYRVQFPNDVYRDLPQIDLYVRWNHPLSSPIEWLANQHTYTPMFQEARVDFQNHMLDQREACAGITAALSSSIALESHQLAVVRRVLSDPIQRYLLADEVGLGKTIEAGLILRQHVLDNPDSHKVLVLVPEALQQQWIRELSERFHLSELLDKSIIVRTYEQYLANQDNFDANLVLIDEAHQVAEWGWSSSPQQGQAYQRIAKQAHTSTKLLLLSATPLVGNERNFLAMLHLLDADNYQLTEQGVVEFSKRVE
ncbi:SNF2-related protein, partial [Vibrio fortis]|uniref:SNF2-related protein n=1 Tax=Vibrio fortis TaxID=212667 RepID=UPI002F40E1CE